MTHAEDDGAIPSLESVVDGAGILGLFVVAVIAACLALLAAIFKQDAALLAASATAVAGIIVAYAATVALRINRRLATSSDALRALAERAHEMNEARFSIPDARATKTASELRVTFDVVNSGWRDSAIRAAAVRFDWAAGSADSQPVTTARRFTGGENPFDSMVRSGERVSFEVVRPPPPAEMHAVRVVLRLDPVVGPAVEHVVEGAPLPAPGELDPYTRRPHPYTLQLFSST